MTATVVMASRRSAAPGSPVCRCPSRTFYPAIWQRQTLSRDYALDPGDVGNRYLIVASPSLAENYFVIPGPVGTPDMVAHGLFITLILTGLFTTKDWVIKTVIPAIFILYCAYITLLFVSLPG